MRLLFLTDNFPPETNAPAVRTWEHARRWAARGHEVHVITGAPNFPLGKVHPGYRNRLFHREEIDGIRVWRVGTYIARNAGFLKRTLDFLSFMVASFLAGLCAPRPDAIVATSPQFFTAVSGWALSALRRRPFVFEVRDLWPETIQAVGALKEGPLLSALAGLANFLYRRADLIVPVTRAFEKELLQRGIPPERLLVVENGIDPESVAELPPRQAVRERHGLPQDAFLAGYVGTLGLCHHLETVLDAAALVQPEEDLHFVLMGEGADKEVLKTMARERGLERVHFIDGMPKEDALAVVGACDAALVILRNSPVFETVLPSKMFDAMALERPIVLAAPPGEARRIVVDEERCGIDAPPEDAHALIGALRRLREEEGLCLQLGCAGLAAVGERYHRTVMAERLINGLMRRFSAEHQADASTDVPGLPTSAGRSAP